MSSNPIPIMGRIDAVAGTTPGPASGITYTIGVNWEGGTFAVEAQVPNLPRWPDQIDGEPAWVQAYPVGTIVPGYYDPGTRTVRWWFTEFPAAGTCAGMAAAPPNPFSPPDKRDPLPPLPPLPPPPVPNSIGSTVSSGSAPDGGGIGE